MLSRRHLGSLFLGVGAAGIGAIALRNRSVASTQGPIIMAELSSDPPLQAPGFEERSDEEWQSLTPAEWKERLNGPSFSVLRQEATERAFTSELNNEKREGWFACAGCGLVLFSSKMKYNSGTGWPSFFDVIKGRIDTKPDRKLFTVRTEYHCARCGGHQGHVFDDGPAPTGQRWCNNGVALVFAPSSAFA